MRRHRVWLRDRKRCVTGGITAMLLCGVCISCSGGGEEQPQAEERQIPVRTLVLGARALEIRVRGSGILEANLDVLLSAQANGEVKAMPGIVGKRVVEGDVVAVIDDALYRSVLKSAEANVMARQSEWEKAKSDLERARRLREKDEISETEFESIELAETAARAALRASEAQLDQARIDFDHTRVRSPIRGMISDTFCEAGELVVAGTPIANVVDLAEMKVRVMLSSEEVAQVSVGDSVRVAVPAYAGEIYSGSVRFISPKADERTRTFHAEVLVENRGEALKAGMVASVRIDVGEVQDALLVPRESVLEEYGERVVFTVLNGRAVRNQVEVTEVDGGRVRVLSGLSPGDRVVVAGQQNLQDGTPVVEQ